MDNTGPITATRRAQLIEMEGDGVDERARPMTFGRVNNHVRWLVDQREKLVLIQDVEGNILRDWCGMGRLGQLDAEMVAVTDLVARLAGTAVDQHRAGFDGILNRGATEVGEILC